MQRLNGDQPCRRSELMTDFRDTVLNAYNIPKPISVNKTCVVTVISRRAYEGRLIDRTWVNEYEILTLMREKYPSCIFRSIDFVYLTMEEQIRTVHESSMIIGMHGAGMANVMWLRESMYVIEIFPKDKRRYGYRNICLYIECTYAEYRGGIEYGENGMKQIFPQHWFNLTSPIIESMIQKLSSL